MLGRLSAGLVIALVSFSTVSDASAATATKTQTKTTTTHKLSATVTKHSAKHSAKRVAYRHRGKSYLIPPPPPYAPSILPELAYARRHRGYKPAAAQQPEKVVSKYVKLGVQSAEGYEDPEPVKANKYVTYWNKG